MREQAAAVVTFQDGNGAPVTVVHCDWRTDARAVAEPWSVRVSGAEIGRRATVGAAGSFARAVAFGIAEER